MIKKLAVYYCFTVVTTMVILGFLKVETYPQLASAALFFPLAVHFWFTVIPKKKRALAIPMVGKVETVKATRVDIDRRSFLKLISSAGVSVFLLSLLTKQAHGAFFGSVPGPGTVGVKDSAGNLVDPAIKHPTDGYKISRLDDSSPAYYGFTNKDGKWFIMMEDASGSYTYAVGTTDFEVNWGVRGTLSYGEYFDKF